jgi:hypothetical protein
MLAEAPNHPRLRLLQTFDGVRAYEVDGLWVRHHIEPDFNNFGSWPRFDTIPEDEFWIDQEVHPDEREFYFLNLLAERAAILNGSALPDAKEVGNAAEQRARRKLEPQRPPDAANQVKITPLQKFPNGVTVWLVDGELVRSWFFINYTEGGHDLVYDWIPPGEIWIDDDVLHEERPLVLTHEFVERSLMEQEGLDYEHAHQLALKVEQRHYLKTHRAGFRGVTAMSTYLKFRGHLYRRAKLWPPSGPSSDRGIHWGPDKWPSDQYLQSLSDRPPMNRDEYEFLEQRVQELKDELAAVSDPADRRALDRSIRELEHRLLDTDQWLYDRNPKSFQSRKWWASTKTQSKK